MFGKPALRPSDEQQKQESRNDTEAKAGHHSQKEEGSKRKRQTWIVGFP
jgi:hypothetical protein